MKEFEKTFSIKHDLVFKIKRITENLNKIFDRCKFISISNSAFFHFYNKISKDPIILPKLYTALTFITGPSDSTYDDYKGSFSFLFDLEVQKNNKTSRYLYHIYHYRSYVEFSLSQVVPDEDPRDAEIMHGPDNELFSDTDISLFSMFFCDYVLDIIDQGICKPEPFIKYSRSNLIVFGFDKNEYFYKQCKNEEEFDDELKTKESD